MPSLAAAASRPGGLPQTPDEMLRALFAHAMLRTYPKNALLVAEGERNPDAIFLIQTGRVKMFLSSAEGKEVDLEVLEPGDCFGEMEIDDGPVSASALAMERTQLLVIRRSEYKAFVCDHADIAMQLIFKLIARNRRLLKSVKSLALLDVSERVARLLLDMATEEDGKLVITEKLSKRDIANRVGATREMASRVFKELVSSGYIRLEQRQITIAKRLPQHW